MKRKIPRSTTWVFPGEVWALACNRWLVAAGLLNGEIETRIISSGEPASRWVAHSKTIKRLVFADDGGLVSVSEDKRISKWEGGSGAALWSRDLKIEINCVTELAGGRLAVGCDDGAVRVIDGRSGQEISMSCGHSRCVLAVISLGRLGTFASASSDRSIRVWAENGSEERVITAWNAWSMAASPCRRLVIVGYYDGSLSLHRLPEWSKVWTAQTHNNSVTGLAWSPYGRIVAVGSRDNTVKIVSVETGDILRTFEGHTDIVRPVCFSADGRSVLSGSFDKSVSIWRIFEQMERKVRALCSALDVGEACLIQKEGLGEVVQRMKRLWEVQ